MSLFTPLAGPAAYPATPTYTLPFMAAAASPAVGGGAHAPSQPAPPTLGDMGAEHAERQRQVAAHVAFLEARCADLARQLQESYDLVARQTREYDHAAVRLQVDERELVRLQDALEDVTRRQRHAHESELARTREEYMRQRSLLLDDVHRAERDLEDAEAKKQQAMLDAGRWQQEMGVLQEQATAHAMACQYAEAQLEAVQDARRADLEDHRRTVAKLRQDLREERDLTARLTRATEQLRGRVARRERERDEAVDERDVLRQRVLEQQQQLQALEDTTTDLHARLAQTVADHNNARDTWTAERQRAEGELRAQLAAAVRDLETLRTAAADREATWVDHERATRERTLAAAGEQYAALLRQAQESERAREAAVRALTELQAQHQQHQDAHERRRTEEAAAAAAATVQQQQQQRMSQLVEHMRAQEQAWAARVAEAEGEAARMRLAVEAAQADANESARMADLLSGALTETRERARRHLLHVERLLATQERLLRERRELEITLEATLLKGDPTAAEDAAQQDEEEGGGHDEASTAGASERGGDEEEEEGGGMAEGQGDEHA